MTKKKDKTSSNIEDIYALSPMQQGLLYETMNGKTTGQQNYVVQGQFEIEGKVNVELFRESWQAVVNRHAILRSAFVYENVEKPVQVVLKERPVPFRFLEDQDLASIGQIAREDLERGFDVQKEPLMRITLIQTGPEKYHLIWSHHHLVMDGWGLSVIERDLFEYYRAGMAGEQPVLLPAPPFSSYIKWLREQDSRQSLAYWKTYLQDFDALTPVATMSCPGLRGPKTVKTTDFTVPDNLTQKLRLLSRQQGVTLNTLLQTAWGCLLSRYNDRSDVLFGSIVSGRPAQLNGAQEIVGVFINAVPVRISYNRSTRFQDLLQQVQKNFLASENHHYIPLADIAGQSGQRQLFDHLFAFENFPVNLSEDSDSHGLTIRQLETHDVTHYPFGIKVTDRDQLYVQFSWNQGLFTEKRVCSIYQHYLTLLQHAVEQPAHAVWNLPFMSLEEESEIHSLSSGRVLEDDVPDILSVINRQTSIHSDAPAVQDTHRALSYRQLEEQSNRLAHDLIEKGIVAESLVAVEMDRNCDLVIALVALLKTGGVYLPIDPELPPERKKAIRNQSDIALSLTGPLPDLSSRPATPPETESPEPGQLAYVIYTSGSTGIPKGCMMTRGNLSHHAQNIRELMFPDGGGSISFISSISFDMTINPLYVPLTLGKTVHLCSGAEKPDRALGRIFAAGSGIDMFATTPSQILALETLNLRETDIHTIMTGGETLSSQHVEILRDINPEMRIFNVYGPTEATVGCSLSRIEKDPEYISIGKPMPGTLHYILDRHRQLLPEGAPGELYIGGMGLSRGYLHQPERTAERFFQIDSLPGNPRMYKTGDKVRWLENGELDYIGRTDQQIKIRGHRIEPGEIEHLMLQHPKVAQAAVRTVSKPSGETAIFGYYVPARRGENDISELDLKEFIRSRLPGFMVPEKLIRMTSFPVTRNGKTDLEQLPASFQSESTPGLKPSPKNSTETKLCEIWKEVLNVESISTSDNFFDIGGHSLKAMQIISRVRNRFQVTLEFEDLYTAPTITELAERIEKSKSEQSERIPKAPEQPDYPLSHAQSRLWLQHNMEAGSAYNMPLTYLIRESIDPAILKEALRQLLERHEILRTAFILKDGQPRQKITEIREVSITTEDFSRYQDPHSQARKRCEDEALKVFDLEQPPLLRVLLLQTGSEEYVIQLCIHHIIGDGWSMKVLFNELILIYEAVSEQRNADLTPLRIQYRDFTMWQIQQDLTGQREFWMTYLEGASPKIYLPYDHEPETESTFTGRHAGLELSAETGNGLRELARQKKTTLSNLVLSLFALLLYKTTGQHDFCLAISTAARNDQDLERMIGFFVNLLPMRVELNDQMEFDDLLATVIHSAKEVYANQDYPFNKLIRDLNPERIGNRQPLANVVYGFQNFADVRLESDSSESRVLQQVEGFPLSFHTAKFDLTLFVYETGDRIRLDLEYDSALFRESTIQAYLETLQSFADMAAEIVNDPSKIDT